MPHDGRREAIFFWTSSQIGQLEKRKRYLSGELQRNDGNGKSKAPTIMYLVKMYQKEAAPCAILCKYRFECNCTPTGSCIKHGNTMYRPRTSHCKEETEIAAAAIASNRKTWTPGSSQQQKPKQGAPSQNYKGRYLKIRTELQGKV